MNITYRKILLMLYGLFVFQAFCLMGCQKAEGNTGGTKNVLAADELLMPASQNNAQMLSAVIRTDQGGLVVIDGGWEEDGEALYQTLIANGGHVNAWFLTHPHSDHTGALRYILMNQKPGLQIDKIYYSFANPEWYEANCPQDAGTARVMLDEFSRLPADMLDNTIGKGTVIPIDDITVTVLNDRYDCAINPVNNSDMVYRVDINGTSVLFLGDLGYEGGQMLLQDYPGDALQSDVVQMAHHGQSGVWQEVYQAIAPEICLWPTPEWLWNNDSGDGPGSGPWQTLETRGWMDQLGVKTHYCTKDGDIRLAFQRTSP